MDKEYLTTNEVKELLGLKNVITVQRWIRKGILPATKFLKDYRISKSDLDRFLAERKVKK
jgi:excisionase family DNA binding protein